jgi:hypothetical protein
MDHTLILLVLLTFIIHLIGTLAYSVRIAGTRTGQIAVSFALFNIMMLGSRTSNSFQGPILAKRVEENLLGGISSNLVSDFRILLISASIATLLGAFLTPTFQRLFTKAVDKFGDYRSIPKLVLRGFTPTGLAYIRNSIAIPVKENIKLFKKGERVPIKYILYNTIATAIWTTGVFSALYAGYLNPDVRVTSSQLSSIINGAATILMFVFIDPYLSILTDDVAHNRTDQAYFRRSVVWLTGSRFAGTLLSQLLLIPASVLIVFVAEKI